MLQGHHARQVPNAALPAGRFPPEIPLPESAAKSSLEQSWASLRDWLYLKAGVGITDRARPKLLGCFRCRLRTKWQSNAHRPDLSGHKLRFNDEKTWTQRGDDSEADGHGLLCQSFPQVFDLVILLG